MRKGIPTFLCRFSWGSPLLLSSLQHNLDYFRFNMPHCNCVYIVRLFESWQFIIVCTAQIKLLMCNSAVIIKWTCWPSGIHQVVKDSGRMHYGHCMEQSHGSEQDHISPYYQRTYHSIVFHLLWLNGAIWLEIYWPTIVDIFVTNSEKTTSPTSRPYGLWSRRPQTETSKTVERPQTETATDRNGYKLERPQTETATNRNGYKPKGHRPKGPQTETATNWNGHKLNGRKASNINCIEIEVMLTFWPILYSFLPIALRFFRL